MRIVSIAIAAGLVACGAPAANDSTERDRVMAANLETAAEKVASREAEAEERQACIDATLQGERYQSAMEAAEASDDYMSRTDQLRRSTAVALCERRCTPADVKSEGGWVRSQNRPGSYFMWCNGRRVYLDSETGRVT